MAQGRSLLKEIVKNFVNSLKPRKYWGELRGKDYLGTEYYESVDLRNSRTPSRWFVPLDPQNFQQEIPPEWEAWLRHRRKVPPTEEEISINRQEMLKRIENSKKFEKPNAVSTDEIKTFGKHELPLNENCELRSATKVKN